MAMRFSVNIIAAIWLTGSASPAQPTAGAANPVGIWRGTSVCQVRPSPCNDEVVVYRITRAKASDSISVDARKIVNGHEEEMGILTCRLAALGASFTCAMPTGVWRFTIRRDSLVGDL